MSDTVSADNTTTLDIKKTIDPDYANSVVPQKERKSGLSLYFVWTGWILSLDAPVTGAALAAGMNIWVAILGIFLGNVILGLIATGTSLAGRRQGSTLTRLSRVSFGNKGSWIYSVFTAIAMAGWFGVSAGLFAAILGVYIAVPVWLIAVVSGALFGMTAVLGMKVLVWFGRFAVPLLLSIVLIAIVGSLFQNGIPSSPVMPGEGVGFFPVVGLAVGHWIAGAAAAPDVARWGKTDSGVTGSAMIGFGIMCTVFMAIGAIAVLTIGDPDFFVGMTQVWNSPLWLFLSLLSIVLVVWTSADKQAYSSGLAISNITGWPHKVTTVIAATFGTILAVSGIYQNILDFLVFLGIFVCPLAAILLVDYFIINRSKYPAISEVTSAVNPCALVAFTAGAAGDYLLGFVNIGVTAINALIIAAVVYYALMKITKYKTHIQSNGKYIQLTDEEVAKAKAHKAA